MSPYKSDSLPEEGQMALDEDRNRTLFDLLDRTDGTPGRDLIDVLNLPLVVAKRRRDCLTRPGL